MKKIILIILFAASALLARAQNDIDKLAATLKKHPDSLGLKIKLAGAHAQASHIDTATLLYTEVVNAALRAGSNVQAYIQAQIGLGRIYADRGENVTALSHYHQAQSQAEQIGDKKLLAHVFKNTGALYISWKKLDNALTYYDKAEQLAASINESELLADCRNNKGTVYEQQLKYDKALTAYKSALAVYTQKNVTAKIAMVLSNLAIVYKFKKDFPTSLQYNLKALALAFKNNDKWIIAATYNNIGALYSEMGNYKQAILYCQKSVDLAKQINAIEIVETAYDSMAVAAAKAGDFKNAYKYQQQFAEHKDKFINLESARQLSELNVKFETAKKEKLIQQQQFAIKQRNMMIIVIAIIFVALLAIAWQIYTRNKLRQKAAMQQAEINYQAKATKGIIEAEENERKRIASDLHDGVGQLFSAVKMNLSGLLERARLTDPVMVALGDKTLGMVDESCKEVRLIAHQMMPDSILKNGLSTAISDFVSKIDPHNLKINVQATNMESRLDSNIETVLYRIVQECVNNVIKHARATQLNISVNRLPDNISVTIQDNGRGFNTADKSRIEGIGLKNIRSRVAYLHGTVDISSAEDQGTVIAIEVPLIA